MPPFSSQRLRGVCSWGFYIFTIITNVTHQIITLRMTPTTIPVERSLSFIFTIFADVARHASHTRWHPVSSSSEMSFLSLICSSLPSLQQLGPRSSSHFHVGPARQLPPLPPAAPVGRQRQRGREGRRLTCTNWRWSSWSSSAERMARSRPPLRPPRRP